MRVLVASDNDVMGGKVCALLLRREPASLEAELSPLKQSLQRLTNRTPELLIVVISTGSEHSTSVLRELRSNFQGPILAVGPSADPKLILRILREGANHFLDELELEIELDGVLGLGSPGLKASGRGRLIALLAPSGGSGSSTLAVNIAIVLAKEHKHCALFDLKRVSGDLAALLSLKPSYSLADLCLHAARLDRVMFERSLVQHASGVALLAAPQLISEQAQLTPAGVGQALAIARSIFPYVVVDLDHSFQEEQAVVLRQAEVILLVFRLDFTSLRNLRTTLNFLEQIGVHQERVSLVANRYGQAKELPAAQAEAALGMRIAHYVPEDPKTINCANNQGVPAVLEAPSAKVSRSIRQLALSVHGKRMAS